ncbi:MAG: hypothetical protein RBS38_14445 [Bacteroidales bacterium]|jgi:hypothetical protein|nr:hypothetical protein [Bacteroidales bacterium]
MSFKSEIYQKDYLFWITPVAILFAIFCMIKRDNRDRESAILHHGSFRSDTTLTLNVYETEKFNKILPADSTLIFFADIKGKALR